MHVWERSPWRPERFRDTQILLAEGSECKVSCTYCHVKVMADDVDDDWVKAFDEKGS